MEIRCFFNQSRLLFCMCKLLCVGHASWRSRILRYLELTCLHTTKISASFLVRGSIIVLFCKKYVKKHQDFVVIQVVVLNLVLNFINL
jgi:hypothetical protein